MNTVELFIVSRFSRHGNSFFLKVILTLWSLYAERLLNFMSVKNIKLSKSRRITSLLTSTKVTHCHAAMLGFGGLQQRVSLMPLPRGGHMNAQMEQHRLLRPAALRSL